MVFYSEGGQISTDLYQTNQVCGIIDTSWIFTSVYVLIMHRAQGIESEIPSVCVCVRTCGVLALFAQLQVLFSVQTTSWSFSHGLISSSNTNVNEAQGKHSDGELLLHMRSCRKCLFTVIV